MTNFEPHELTKISAAAPDVELTAVKTRDEFRQRLPQAEVVYGSLTTADLELARNLTWVQTPAAGVENLEPAVVASPVVLTNMARVFAPAITETAHGHAALPDPRHHQALYAAVREAADELGRHRQVARTMSSSRERPWGSSGWAASAAPSRGVPTTASTCAIVATDARPVPQPHYVAELRDPSWFKTMVPMVDVLVAAAPHTPLTERMFDESVFRSMKKTAYFLALSRGMLFDDLALVKALQGGWIAGAGLDVFPKEPPPSDHPIFDCTNVVMTAHTSGWSPDRQVRLVDLFAENVRRYAIGAPLLNVVDKKAGY